MGNRPSRIMKDIAKDQSPKTTQSDDEQSKRAKSGNNPNTGISSYPKQENEKGYVLIINYKFRGTANERVGSDQDVSNLKKFFNAKNYKTDLQGDMSTKHLRNYLEEVRDTKLELEESVYHCFFCVVMSHGNESDVDTTDGSIARNEIVDYFRNDKLKNFIGKPKIFMFQSCRGNESQQKHGNQEPRSTLQRDNSNVTARLPTDADIMIIYATTHGYFSYRTANGSWLVKAFLDTAKKHPDKHIGEVMTGVKNELANNKEYEDENGQCQIAVSEDTLTKLLYL